MSERFSRTELLLGKEALAKLASSRIAVFGVGGVGGYAVEGLARSGIGAFDLIDNDVVCESNLNRQIIATEKTIGCYKADVAKERILSINPSAVVNVYRTFYLPETAGQFDFSNYDYVVDAIDTVTGKIALVLQAQAANVPVISSMGAGNKTDPTRFKVTDIYQTSVDPLAKIMRTALKKRGVKKLKVVWSDESPVSPVSSVSPAYPDEEKNSSLCAEGKISPVRRSVPGSLAFVPSVVGLIIAGEVVKDIAKVTFSRKGQ